MNRGNSASVSVATVRDWFKLDTGAFIVATFIIVLGFFLLYPVLLILGLSFNTAMEFFAVERVWGLANWRIAFSEPRIFQGLFNTVWLWFVSAGFSFPVAITIAWLLARTRIPFSHGLEFLFWIAYVAPGGLIGWIMLFDKNIGMANAALEMLPFIDQGPFNIFSVPGIIFVSIMSSGISLKVMLLTPAFRNMDAALEEAARVGGASKVRTMLRVTIPLMISPIALVFALQLMRMFNQFESELILGIPIGFYVYSTVIYDLVRMQEPPLYGQATALASLTLVLIAFIIPLQRWILQRRRYTTITGSFKPGLVDLGPWAWVAFGVILFYHMFSTFLPLAVMVGGSLMTKSGYFMLDPLFTFKHWQFVLNQELFYRGLRTTLILASTTAILSPLLFAIIAYILVRTRWRFRAGLDAVIWVSAAVPGMLSSLGLLLMFLWTPGLNFLYGTIWALLIVVILQGNTTGVNITKGSIVQVGFDMEEAARVAGMGWFATFFRIWVPLLLPTLVLIGTMNFVIASGTTASIILLASRDSTTLSILILEWLLPGSGRREAAAVVQTILGTITVAVALIARRYGIVLGVRHI
ncbi:MAG: ABC transporter permease subunit [Deltaproteobacteria bacterium]|nr:ABC transporter permease subunit [Deltaproteobacteria bacterium]